jgi:DNA mismatch endonuclease (patch repair protein)
MDILTPEKRSAVMRAIKGRSTRPEIKVRRLLHSMGFRFHLHRKDLPGTPDIVLPKFRTAIFVNGCFWHAHDDPGCRLSGVPASNREFWERKFARNRERDGEAALALSVAGWRVVTIWECRLKGAGMEGIIRTLQGIRDGIDAVAVKS